MKTSPRILHYKSNISELMDPIIYTGRLFIETCQSGQYKIYQYLITHKKMDAVLKS